MINEEREYGNLEMNRQYWYKQEKNGDWVPDLAVTTINPDELSEEEGNVKQTSGIRERILEGGKKLGDRNRLHKSTPSKWLILQSLELL